MKSEESGRFSRREAGSAENFVHREAKTGEGGRYDHAVPPQRPLLGVSRRTRPDVCSEGSARRVHAPCLGNSGCGVAGHLLDAIAQDGRIGDLDDEEEVAGLGVALE